MSDSSIEHGLGKDISKQPFAVIQRQIFVYIACYHFLILYMSEIQVNYFNEGDIRCKENVYLIEGNPFFYQIFMKPDFALDDSSTFNSVLPWSHFNTAGGKGNRDAASSKLLQEKVTFIFSMQKTILIK